MRKRLDKEYALKQQDVDYRKVKKILKVKFNPKKPKFLKFPKR
jgi:hypothetical protein